MGWWKVDPVPAQQAQPQAPVSKIPMNHPPVADGVSQDACPVDHKTREIWLQAAKRQREQSREEAVKTMSSPTPTTTARPPAPPQPASQSWLSYATTMFGASPAQTPSQPKQTTQRTSMPASTPAPTSTPKSITEIATSSEQCSSETVSDLPQGPSVTFQTGKHTRTLSHDREVSTIPRGAFSPTANNEIETGSSNGNWVYPSETQFFNAVMRKSTTTTTPEDLASSVSSIIPIHNAVNERAWAMIRKWEGDRSKACGGPKLCSFKGLGGGAISPRARWKSFWGAREPFDRHDWVVERCGGERVEYLIDFYQGKESDDPRRRTKEVNFYLDVRPKLNSVEGCRMRFEKYWGL